MINNAYLFDFPIHEPYYKLTEEQRHLLWSGNEYFHGLDEFFQYIESERRKIQFRVMKARYTGKSIPFVGLFVMFLQSYSGIVTIAAVIYCLLMIEWVGDKIYKARMARLLILQDSIDFKKETEVGGDITSSFVETIRFRNIIYTFDENGFVDKTVLDDDELIAEADSDDVEQTNDSETPPN